MINATEQVVKKDGRLSSIDPETSPTEAGAASSDEKAKKIAAITAAEKILSLPEVRDRIRHPESKRVHTKGLLRITETISTPPIPLNPDTADCAELEVSTTMFYRQGSLGRLSRLRGDGRIMNSAKPFLTQKSYHIRLGWYDPGQPGEGECILEEKLNVPPPVVSTDSEGNVEAKPEEAASFAHFSSRILEAVQQAGDRASGLAA
jgi:hypothetical protein